MEDITIFNIHGEKRIIRDKDFNDDNVKALYLILYDIRLFSSLFKNRKTHSLIGRHLFIYFKDTDKEFKINFIVSEINIYIVISEKDQIEKVPLNKSRLTLKEGMESFIIFRYNEVYSSVKKIVKEASKNIIKNDSYEIYFKYYNKKKELKEILNYENLVVRDEKEIKNILVKDKFK